MGILSDIAAEADYTPEQFLQSKLASNTPFDEFGDYYAEKYNTVKMLARPDYEAQRAEMNRLPNAIAQERAARNSESDKAAFARNLLTRAVPFGSSILNLAMNEQVKNATNRANAGTASDSDYDAIARRQVQQEIDDQESAGAAIGKAAFHIPALVGEAGVAGKLVGGLGRAVGFGGKAAPLAQTGMTATAADVAGSAAQTGAYRMTGGEALGALGKHIGRSAAMTPAMPSVYLEQASKNSEKNGGEWYDMKNLGPAYAMGVGMTAILGTLQGRFGNSVPTMAGRTIAKTAVAAPEQVAVDVLGGISGMSDGYGVTGELWNAKTDAEKERANKHLYVTMATFGMFSAMHARHKPGEPYKPSWMPEFTDYMKSQKQAGANRDEAVQRAATDLFDPINDHIQKYQDLTYRDVVDMAEAAPDGSAKRRFLDKYAEEMKKGTDDLERRSAPPEQPPAEAPKAEATQTPATAPPPVDPAVEQYIAEKRKQGFEVTPEDAAAQLGLQKPATTAPAPDPAKLTAEMQELGRGAMTPEKQARMAELTKQMAEIRKANLPPDQAVEPKPTGAEAAPKKTQAELDAATAEEERRFAEQQLAGESNSRPQSMTDTELKTQIRMQETAKLKAAYDDLQRRRALIPGEPVTKADRDLVKEIQQLEQEIAKSQYEPYEPIKVEQGDDLIDVLIKRGGLSRKDAASAEAIAMIEDSFKKVGKKTPPGLITNEHRRYGFDTIAKESAFREGERQQGDRFLHVPESEHETGALMKELQKSINARKAGKKGPSISDMLGENDTAIENRMRAEGEKQLTGYLDNAWAEKEKIPDDELAKILEEARGLYSQGPLPPQPKGVGAGGVPATKPEIVKTLETIPEVTLFQTGTPSKLNKNAVAAAYKQGRHGSVGVDKWWRDEPRVVMEEVAHILAAKYKVEFDPAKLPQDVRDGLVEFDLSRSGNGKLGMQEGFGQWAVRRMANELGNLTANQQAAANWAEAQVAKWVELPKINKAREMFMKWDAANPVAKAATHLGMSSASGQTRGEKLSDTFEGKADDFAVKYLNDLHGLQMIKSRMIEMNKERKRLGQAQMPLTDIEKAIHAATREKAGAASVWAQEFKDKGFWEIDHNGEKKYKSGKTLTGAIKDSGISKDRLIPLDQKGEGPMMQLVRTLFGGKNESGLGLDAYKMASEADAFMVARHIIDEVDNRGKTNIVRPDQLQEMRDAMDVFKKAPDYANLVKFHDYITDLFNESREVLASPEIHRLNEGEVRRNILVHPTYVELSRVQQDGETTKGIHSAGRKGSGEQIQPPLMALDRRFSVTASEMARQMKMNALVKVLSADGIGEFAAKGEPLKQTSQGAAKEAEIQRLKNSPDPLDHRKAEEMELMGDAEDYKHAPWEEGKDNTVIWHGQDGRPISIAIKNKILYDMITDRGVDADTTAKFLHGIASTKIVKLNTKIAKGLATGTRSSFHIMQVPADVLEFLSNTIDRTSIVKLPKAYIDMAMAEWRQLLGLPVKGKLAQTFIEGGGRDLKKYNFDPRKPQSIYEQVGDKSSVVSAKDKIIDIAKKLLAAMGSTELGPRFLEYQNYLKQVREPNGRLRYDMKAVDAGRQEVKWDDHLGAMYAASEVTVNFNRLGTRTREINRITPYFGPAVAGVTKAIRNARDNPTGAVTALGMAAVLRLMHWWAYKDEDWYKKLSSEDRRQFVFPVGNGRLFKLPGFRDFHVLTGGALISGLDQARGQDPRWKDTIDQSIKALLPPGIGEGVADIAKGGILPGVMNIGLAAGGPIVNTAGDLIANRQWTGAPVVPTRDQGTTQEYQWAEHRMPYIFKQLTMGRFGGGPETAQVWKSLGLDFFREVYLNKPVSDFYERMHDVKAKVETDKRRGKIPDAASSNELKRLEAASKQIDALSWKIRGEVRNSNGVIISKSQVTEEQKRAYKDQQMKIAERALGR